VKVTKLILATIITFCALEKTNAQCWNLVWADEFNGSSLDGSKWSYQTGAGGWGNNELQNYTDRIDNTQVSGGTLKIIAKQENFNGSNYTSARIRTINKGDFRYGRIEMYAKLPQTQSLWPAFWMMPTDNVYGTWPNSGELDIMELLGHQPATTYGTIHTSPTGGGSGSNYSSSNYTLPSGTFASGFHTHAVEWEPTAIRWYVDNTLYATKTPADLSPWRFTELFHIILNIAVGGNWPGPPNGTTVFPQTMEVDYVRVYQRNEDLTISGKRKVEPAETTTYSVSTIAGASYNWTVSSGMSIVSGQGTPQVTVTFGATTGAVTCAVTTSCGSVSPSRTVEVSANAVDNPSFEEDFQYWTRNFYGGSGAYASMAISTVNPQHLLKKACVTTNQLPPSTWDIQLSKSNLNLVAGQSYTLKFWASADAPNKTIAAAVIHASTYAVFKYQTFNIGTTWQEYSFVFTPSSSANVLLNFDCGHSIGTVFFDNVVFGKTAFLPLDLIEFKAEVQDKNNALLTWVTSNERDLSRYELERSTDSNTFSTVYTKDITGQNSIEQTTYNHTDKNLNNGTYYYRLKIVETDGNSDYSPIVEVIVQGDKKLIVFPNPTKGKITISHQDKGLGELTIQLYNAAAQLVLSQTTNSDTTELDIAHLPQGTYLLKVGEETFWVVFD
jgi:beta-glucanase (GH16 family)